MANECLVTKLKGVVDADLPKLGCSYAYPKGTTKQTANFQAFNYRSANGCTVTIIGGNYNFSDRQGNDTGLKTVTLIGNQALYDAGYVLPKSANTGKLEFTNKYETTAVEFNPNDGDSFSCDLEQYRYCPNIFRWHIPAGDYRGDLTLIGPSVTDLLWQIPGNLSDINPATRLQLFNCSYNNNLTGNLPDMSEIRTLRTQACTTINPFSIEVLGQHATVLALGGSPATGNVGNIGNLTELTTLWINNTQCTGTIEAFVSAQVAAGRTSGTVAVDIHASEVTYQGKHTNCNTKDLKWVNGVITEFDVTFAD